MPGTTELDGRPEGRLYCAVFLRKHNLGVENVDFRQGCKRLFELIQVLPHQHGQPDQNPVFLGRDFFLREQQSIVEFDRKQRFDEHGLTRPGTVLDNPRQPRLKIGPDGNDKTVIPNRNKLVSCHLLGLA